MHGRLCACMLAWVHGRAERAIACSCVLLHVAACHGRACLERACAVAPRGLRSGLKCRNHPGSKPGSGNVDKFCFGRHRPAWEAVVSPRQPA